jgi:hypothetical protein
MAFKKLQNKNVAAVSLGKDKGSAKQVSGYLVGLELDKGTRKNSTIYSLQQKDGTIVKVWGSYSIDSVLLIGEKKARTFQPGVSGIMVRFTFKGVTEFGKGKKKQTVKEIDVEVDPSDKVKPGKDYVLKKV